MLERRRGVMDLASADRAVEPGMETRMRNVQVFAKPTDGPIVVVLGDEGEPHIASRAKKSCRFLQDVTPFAGKTIPRIVLWPGSNTQTRDLFLQSCNLGQIGPHLPVPGKRHSWCGGQLAHPASQDALSQIEVTGGLSHRHTPIRHQPYGLDLELARKLPPRHFHSPVPWSRSYLRVHETGSRSNRFFCV
jgi:hypothetical protein